MRWLRDAVKRFIVRAVLEDYRNCGRVRQMLKEAIQDESASAKK